MAFTPVHLLNLTELKTRIGGSINPTLATILGINYPYEEAWAVYRWDDVSTLTPDDFEVVQPTPRLGMAGRWIRIDLEVTPHQHPMNEVIGLISALDLKLEEEVDPTVGTHLKEITTTQINNWNSAFNWGNHAGLYKSLNYSPTIGEITGLQNILDNKITTGSSIPYSTITGTPTIPVLNNSTITTALGYTPYNTSNPSGYITASGAPVQSVNTKTGVVALNKSDIGLSNVDNTSDSNKPISTATQTALNGKLSSANIPFSKVKYYTVTSDSSSVWTLNLGSDFTTILDVQVTAMSTGNTVGGVRQASLNSWTSTSTTLNGITFGNNTVPVLLIASVQTLALLPSTTVRITVYGN